MLKYLNKFKIRIISLVALVLVFVSCFALANAISSETNEVEASENYNFDSVTYDNDEVSVWSVNANGILDYVVFKVHDSWHADSDGIYRHHNNFPKDNYSISIPGNVTGISSEFKIYREYWQWYDGYSWYTVNGVSERPSRGWHLRYLLSNTHIGNLPINVIKFPSSLTSVGSRAFVRANFNNTLFDYNDCANIKTIGDNPYVAKTDSTNRQIVAWPEFTPLLTSVGASAFEDMLLTEYVENESFNADGIQFIGDKAFRSSNHEGLYMQGLKVVTLGEGLYTIGDYAFENCRKIESIIVPENVGNIEVNANAKIGKYAFKHSRLITVIYEAHVLSEGLFSDCSSLQSIDLSTEITVITTKCFEFCSSLTSIDLNPNIVEIESFAFQSTNFANFVLPAGCTTLGNSAFLNCASLLNIDLANVEVIGDQVFEGCAILEEITIPATIKSIGHSTFKGDTSLKRAEFKRVSYVDESSVKHEMLTVSMFEDCISLTSVIFDNYLNVTSVPASFMKNCTSMKEFDLVTDSSNIVSIGSYAYYNTAFEYLNARNSSCVIGDFAFAENNSLITVIINAAQINDNAFENCKGITTVEIGSNANKTATASGVGANVFKGCESLTSISFSNNVIGASMFEGCKALRSVVIPSSVNALIGNRAFANCTELNSVTFQNNILGSYMFDNDQNLTQVVLSENLTEIPAYAFYNSYLTSITIPSKVDTIGASAFEHSLSLASIDIKNTIIGKRMFAQCSNLVDVVIPYYVTEIGEQAFTGLDADVATLNLDETTDKRVSMGLKTVVFETKTTENEVLGVQTIGKEAFAYCNLLYTSGTLVVPSTLTTIGDNAFAFCGITSVDIESTSLGNNMFAQCSALGSITIGENVVSLGTQAFYKCTNLELATLNNQETSANMFSSCPNLTTVRLTRKLKTIKSYTFAGCSRLSSIEFKNDEIDPDTGLLGDPLVIESYAFSGCTILSTITIPNNTASIGQGAFAGCVSLTSMTLPFVGKQKYTSGLARSAETVFGWIFGTTRATNLPEGKTELEVVSKYNANNSLTFYIPEGLRQVTIQKEERYQYGAFYNCTKLTKITTPETLKAIEDYAFYNCDGLTTVTLPNSLVEGSVAEVGNHVFDNCSSLTSVSIELIGKLTDGTYMFSNCSALRTASVNLTEIPSYMFAKVSGATSALEEVTIPYCTIIKSHAFEGCDNLSKINLFDNGSNKSTETSDEIITTIEDAAFKDCTSLNFVRLSGSLTTIGANAFNGCYGLRNIVLPASLTTIGTLAFANCSYVDSNSSYVGLESAYILGTKIGVQMFQNSKALKEVQFNNSTTEIPNRAFNGCTSLINLELPTSLTTLGQYAFYDCDSLESIIIPSTVNTYTTEARTVEPNKLSIAGSYAFMNCDGLQYVSFKNSKIGTGMFMGCTHLIKVAYGSVTSIPEFAFYGCSSYVDLNLPDNSDYFKLANGNNGKITSIGRYAFANIRNLSTLIIPNTVTYIDMNAFWNDNVVDLTIPFIGEARNPSYERTAQANVSIMYVRGTLGWIFGANSNQLDRPCTRAVSAGTRYESGDYQVFLTYYCYQGIYSATVNGESKMEFWYLPSSLKKITVTDQPTIPLFALWGANSLEEINISDHTTYINYTAFYYCYNLKTLTVPFIGLSATAPDSYFRTTILANNNGSTKYGNSHDARDFCFYGTIGAWFYQAPGGYISYTQGSGWRYQNVNETLTPRTYQTVNGTTLPSWIPKTLKTVNVVNHNATQNVTIHEGAFYNCSNIENINFEGNIVGIAKNAFYGCGVKNLEILEKTTNVAEGAYSGATALQNVILYNNNVSNLAFNGDTSLQNVSFMKENTTIGNSAFKGCTGLNTLVLNANVTSIGNSILEGCRNLNTLRTHITKSYFVNYFVNGTPTESAHLSENVANNTEANPFNFIFDGEIIPTDFFKYLTSNINVELKDSVTTLGQESFAYMKGIKYIYIPTSVQNIGINTFAYTTSLVTVEFGYGHTKVVEGMFMGCTSLENVNSIENENNQQSIKYVYVSNNVFRKYVNNVVTDEYFSAGVDGVMGTSDDVSNVVLISGIFYINHSTLGQNLVYQYAGNDDLLGTEDDYIYALDNISNITNTTNQQKIAIINDVIYLDNGDNTYSSFNASLNGNNYEYQEISRYVLSIDNQNNYNLGSAKTFVMFDNKEVIDAGSNVTIGKHLYITKGSDNKFGTKDDSMVLETFINDYYIYDLVYIGQNLYRTYFNNVYQRLNYTYENSTHVYSFDQYFSGGADPENPVVNPQHLHIIVGSLSFDEYSYLSKYNFSRLEIDKNQKINQAVDNEQILIENSNYGIATLKITEGVPAIIKAADNTFYIVVKNAHFTGLIDNYTITNDIYIGYGKDGMLGTSDDIIGVSPTFNVVSNDASEVSYKTTIVQKDTYFAPLIHKDITSADANSANVKYSAKTLAETFLRIDRNAFKDCTSLHSLDIKSSQVGSGNDITYNGVNYIGHYAFSKSSLEEVILPKGLTFLGERAFEATKLKTVEVFSAINTLGDETFIDCSDLETATVHSKINSKGMFKNCTSLETVNLALEVETISESMFENDSSLKTVNFMAYFVERINHSLPYGYTDDLSNPVEAIVYDISRDATFNPLLVDNKVSGAQVSPTSKIRTLHALTLGSASSLDKGLDGIEGTADDTYMVGQKYMIIAEDLLVSGDDIEVVIYENYNDGNETKDRYFANLGQNLYQLLNINNNVITYSTVICAGPDMILATEDDFVVTGEFREADGTLYYYNSSEKLYHFAGANNALGTSSDIKYAKINNVKYRIDDISNGNYYSQIKGNIYYLVNPNNNSLTLQYNDGNEYLGNVYLYNEKYYLDNLDGTLNEELNNNLSATSGNKVVITSEGVFNVISSNNYYYAQIETASYDNLYQRYVKTNNNYPYTYSLSEIYWADLDTTSGFNMANVLKRNEGYFVNGFGNAYFAPTGRLFVVPSNISPENVTSLAATFNNEFKEFTYDSTAKGYFSLVTGNIYYQLVVDANSCSQRLVAKDGEHILTNVVKGNTDNHYYLKNTDGTYSASTSNDILYFDNSSNQLKVAASAKMIGNNDDINATKVGNTIYRDYGDNTYAVITLTTGTYPTISSTEGLRICGNRDGILDSSAVSDSIIPVSAYGQYIISNAKSDSLLYWSYGNDGKINTSDDELRLKKSTTYQNTDPVISNGPVTTGTNTYYYEKLVANSNIFNRYEKSDNSVSGPIYVYTSVTNDSPALPIVDGNHDVLDKVQYVDPKGLGNKGYYYQDGDVWHGAGYDGFLGTADDSSFIEYRANTTDSPVTVEVTDINGKLYDITSNKDNTYVLYTPINTDPTTYTKALICVGLDLRITSNTFNEDDAEYGVETLNNENVLRNKRINSIYYTHGSDGLLGTADDVLHVSGYTGNKEILIGNDTTYTNQNYKGKPVFNVPSFYIYTGNMNVYQVLNYADGALGEYVASISTGIGNATDIRAGRNHVASIEYTNNIYKVKMDYASTVNSTTAYYMYSAGSNNKIEIGNDDILTLLVGSTEYQVQKGLDNQYFDAYNYIFISDKAIFASKDGFIGTSDDLVSNAEYDVFVGNDEYPYVRNSHAVYIRYEKDSSNNLVETTDYRLVGTDDIIGTTDDIKNITRAYVSNTYIYYLTLPTTGNLRRYQTYNTTANEALGAQTNVILYVLNTTELGSVTNYYIGSNNKVNFVGADKLVGTPDDLIDVVLGADYNAYRKISLSDDGYTDNNTYKKYNLETSAYYETNNLANLYSAGKDKIIGNTDDIISGIIRGNNPNTKHLYYSKQEGNQTVYYTSPTNYLGFNDIVINAGADNTIATKDDYYNVIVYVKVGEKEGYMANFVGNTNDYYPSSSTLKAVLGVDQKPYYAYSDLDLTNTTTGILYTYQEVINNTIVNHNFNDTVGKSVYSSDKNEHGYMNIFTPYNDNYELKNSDSTTSHFYKRFNKDTSNAYEAYLNAVDEGKFTAVIMPNNGEIRPGDDDITFNRTNENYVIAANTNYQPYIKSTDSRGNEVYKNRGRDGLIGTADDIDTYLGRSNVKALGSKDNYYWATLNNVVREINPGNDAIFFTEDDYYIVPTVQPKAIPNMLPKEVTEIQAKAFKGTTKLTEFEFVYRDTTEEHQTLVKLGDYAFAESGLREIELPYTLNTPNEGSIGKYVFSENRDLTSVKFNEFDDTSKNIQYKWTYIPEGMFEGDYSLETLQFYNLGEELNPNELSPSITDVGDFAFKNTYGGNKDTKYIDTLIFPVNLVRLGEGAFDNSDIKHVIFKSENTTYGASAFANSKLIDATFKKIVIIPTSFFDSAQNFKFIKFDEETDANKFASHVTTIGAYAFRNTDMNYQSLPVIFNNGLVKVCNNAFESSLLTKVYISKTSVDTSDDSSGNRFEEDVFKNCLNLEEAEFEYGVEVIPEGIFDGCTSLTDVWFYDFAENRTIVGEDTTGSFTTYTITPKDPLVTSGTIVKLTDEQNRSGYFASTIREIGDNAFRNCLLNFAVFTNTLTTIGAEAFKNNYKADVDADDNIITEYGIPFVIIPKNVTTIGDEAFAGCKNVSYVDFKNTTLGNKMFYDCTGLVSLTIPDKVDIIGSYAFQNCSRLATVMIPNSVKRIELGAFYNCTAIENLTLPFIGDHRGSTGEQGLFGWIFGYAPTEEEGTKQYFAGDPTDSNNQNYRSFYISNNLRSIIITDESLVSYGAFMNTSLTSITLPTYTNDSDAVANGNTIHNYFIDGNNNVDANLLLDYVIYNNQVLYKYSDEVYYSLNQAKTKAHKWNADVDSEGKFLSASDANVEFDILHTKTDANSNNYTLYYIRELVKIGDYAFYNCSSMNSASIPSQVTEIGNYSFANCIALNNIEIPSGIDTIGNYAFFHCEHIEAATIPSTAVNLGSFIFAYCYRLKDLHLYNSTLGENMFSNCSSIEKLIVPSGVSSIAARTFENCSALYYLVIPENVTYIGAGAFYGCTNLRVLVIPFVGEKVENSNGGRLITNSSFKYFFDGSSNIPESLKEVYVTNAKTLGDYAFDECYYLERIYVTTDSDAFDYEKAEFVFNRHADNLDKVYYTDSTDTHGKTAYSQTDYAKDTYEYIINQNGSQNALIEKYHDNTNELYEEENITYGLYVSSYITDIGIRAFANVDAIRYARIESSNLANAKLGFYDCDNLLLAYIENATGSLAEELFRNCIYLKMVYIPDGITNVGRYLLRYTPNLKVINVPFLGNFELKTNFDSTINSINNNQGIEHSISWYFATDKAYGGTKTGSVPSNFSLVSFGSSTAYYAPASYSLIIRNENHLATYSLDQRNGSQGLVRLYLSSNLKYIGQEALFKANACQKIAVFDYNTGKIKDLASSYSANTFEDKYLASLCDGWSDAWTSTHSSGWVRFGYTVPKMINGTTTLKDKNGNDIKDTAGNSIYINGTIVNNGNGQNVTVMVSQLTAIGYTALGQNDSWDHMVIPNSVQNTFEDFIEENRRLTFLVIPFIGDSRSTPKAMQAIVDTPDSYSRYNSDYYSNNSRIRTIYITDASTIAANTFYNASNIQNIYLRPGSSDVYTTDNFSAATNWLVDGDTFGTNVFAATPDYVVWGETELKTIGESAIRYTSMRNFIIPSTVTTLGNYIFYDSDNLQRLYDNSSADPSYQMCYDADGITHLYIPFKDIIRATSYRNGDAENSYNGNLQYVYALNATVVEEYAFWNRWTLKKAYFDKLVTIGQYAFYRNENLVRFEPITTNTLVGENVERNIFERSVKTIANDAFNGSYRLEWVLNRGETYTADGKNIIVIGKDNNSTIEFIGDRAFHRCDGLGGYSGNPLGDYYVEMYFPNNLTSVGNWAFDNCDDIYIIHVGSNVNTWGTRVFFASSQIKEFYSDSRFLGQEAFGAPNDSSDNYFNGNSWGQNSGYLNACDKNLTKVYAPKVENIRFGTFYNCTGLRDINISGATTIQQYAFYNCTSLANTLNEDGTTTTGISLPNVTNVLYDAFYNCTSMPKIDMPEVKNIGEYAFYNTTNLAIVNMPKVERIDQYAFRYSKINTVNLESATQNTTIGIYAFADCTNLTLVNMPKLAIIPEHAFYNCTSLVTAGFSGTTQINNYAFQNCTSLKNIVLDAVTTLGTGVFYDCYNLVYIHMYSIANVAVETFRGCTKLRVVQLPNATTLQARSFYGASSLTSTSTDLRTLIGLNSDNSDAITIKVGPNVSDTDNLTYDDFEAIKTDLSEVLTINEYTFYGCSSLTNLNKNADENFAYKVKQIDQYAFNNCSGLLYVRFEAKDETNKEDCLSIGNYAFYQCPNLIEFVAPNVRRVGVCAFHNDDKLTTVSMNDYVGTIAESAFNDCSALTTINMTYVVQSDYRAFFNCTALVNVHIPTFLTIGQETFYYCSALQNVSMETLVYTVGTSAFYNDDSLVNVTMYNIGDDNHTGTIKNHAFYDCDNLTNFYIDKLNIIEEQAFYSCNKLKYDGFIDSTDSHQNPFNETITSIARYAFYDCDSLYFPITDADDSKITFIGEYAFAECAILANDRNNTNGGMSVVDLPVGLTTLQQYAFYNSGILEVVLHSYLTSIGNYVFAKSSQTLGITYIEKVTVYGNSLAFGMFERNGKVDDSNSETGRGLVNRDTKHILFLEGENGQKLTNLPQQVFNCCRNIENFEIPDSVTEIFAYALQGLNYLTNEGYSKENGYKPTTEGGNATDVTNTSISDSRYDTDGYYRNYNKLYVPTGVLRIRIHAFRLDPRLKEIVIPGDAMALGGGFIEYGVFGGCASLERLTVPFVGYQKGLYRGTQYDGANTMSYLFYDGTNYGSNQYCAETVLSYGSNNGIDGHKMYATTGNSYHYGTWIPYSLEKITITQETHSGYCGFYTFVNVKEIVLNEGFKFIGESCFNSCYNLNRLYSSSDERPEEGVFLLPNSLENIQQYAFHWCFNVTDMVVRNKVTYMGQGIFSTCRNLESLTIPFVGTNRTTTDTNFAYLFHPIYDGAMSRSKTYSVWSNNGNVSYPNDEDFLYPTYSNNLGTVVNKHYGWVNQVLAPRSYTSNTTTTYYDPKDSSITSNGKTNTNFLEVHYNDDTRKYELQYEDIQTDVSFSISAWYYGTVQDPYDKYAYRLIPDSLKYVTLTNTTQLPVGA